MNSIRVKVKKLHENAKLPVKSKKDDFCYDVFAATEEEIAPNVWRYGLGLAFEIEKCPINIGKTVMDIASEFDYPIICLDDEKSPIILDLDFRPRSSVWKTGMSLSNAEGTLDFGYRGEVAAVFYHILPDMPRYKVGDRIGQIKLGFTYPLDFEFVDEINMNTDRGEGGFGSTGK